MSRPSTKLLLSLVSLALVLALFALDLGRTSPGEISPVHARIPELQGSDGCDACHGGFGESMQSACLECHAAIASSLDAKQGLHGVLAATDCARCHTEHHGADVELSGARAFAQAGIPDRSAYDHAALGFTLEGAHTELACVRCHANADAVLLEKGASRFLGLSRDCASCHEDPHQGRMQRACVDCHGQSRPFKEVATFEHGANFEGRGAHARAACLDCHAAGGDHSVEALGERTTPPTARRCVDCHASPHAPGFLQQSVPLVAANADAACAACHDPERDSFHAPVLPATTDWHAATGFALAKPHADVACAKCHADYGAGAGQAAAGAALFAARYPGRKASECASCHADPHAGQFAAGPRAAQGCLGCHAAEHFVPAQFAQVEHARTAFPLDGAHVQAACAKCHTVDPSLGERVVRFAGTPRECGACHVDAHDGRFARAEIRAAFPDLATRGCAACHDTQSFSGAARERFDHARLAGFPLDGGHARAACESCHPQAAAPDAAGRRFGRASDRFPGPASECATCHVDVHDGAFLARRGAVQPAGCDDCHTTESFRGPPARDFDHGGWAGFALEGAHRRAECARCHAPLPAANAPRPGQRTFARAKEAFRGPFDRCEGCHADPHEGRFDRPGTPASVRGAVGCARCHTQESFAGASSEGFDHRSWTGFDLQGAHAEAACVACHAPEPQALAAGRSSLGRASGSACTDCHADPHAGQFQDGGPAGCASCHDPAQPFSEFRFDHQRDSRFALDPTHAKLACSACHVPAALASGARVVRYKPLGTTCADCHGFKKGG